MSVIYKYWNELPCQNLFFKIMIGDFQHQLRIPRAFIANFKEELLDWCILRGPSKNTWKVGILRTENDVLFTNRWEKFVTDHGLMISDLLVFQYSGHFTFDVLIFTATGCASTAAYFVQENSQVEQADFNPETTGQTSEDAAYQCPPASHSAGDAEGSNNGGRKYKICHKSNRRLITQQEIDETYAAANQHLLQATRPCVLITLLPTHVYNGFTVAIPKHWALKNVPQITHDIELRVQPGGRKWHVGCRWLSEFKSQCHFRAGWREFVLGNNLEDQDVCVFELVKERTGKGKKKTTMTTTMDVFIFRVVKDVVPLTEMGVQPRKRTACKY